MYFPRDLMNAVLIYQHVASNIGIKAGRIDEEKAVEFWRSGACDFEMILVTDDGRAVISAGLEESFTVEEGYVCETVS